MADKGEFPKTTGDIVYAADVNLTVVPFNASIETTVAVTTTTSTLDISSLTDCSSIVLYNIGSADIFFRFAATAVITDFPLRIGEKLEFTNVSFDRIDVITASATSELSVIVKEDLEFEGHNTNYELLTMSTTAASATSAFTSTTTYKDILVANTGSNDVYITFGITAALTDLKIPSGETIYLGFTDQYQLAGICDTALTSTLKILGVY